MPVQQRTELNADVGCFGSSNPSNPNSAPFFKTDTDIQMGNDPTVNWSYNTTGNAAGNDFYAAILHEIGHVLGLAHVIDPNGELMHYLLPPNPASASRVTLTSGRGQSLAGAVRILNDSRNVSWASCVPSIRPITTPTTNFNLITGPGGSPYGDNYACPYDKGSIGIGGSWSAYHSNVPGNGYSNDIGEVSDDIFYKFNLTADAQVTISTCGSTFDTYLHLLNSSGGVITYNDDSGPECATSQASIKINLPAGIYYVVTEGYGRNSGPIQVRVSASAITSPAIVSNPINPSVTYVGANVSVSFSAPGFNAGNVFTAQLSDATGSFANPVNIGTLLGNTSGLILATIPAGIATGSGYRIRVISSNPVVTGTDNGLNLIINTSSASVAVVANIDVCSGSSVALSIGQLRDGLLASYPFNGNAIDASGNGKNGTVYGATLTADRFGNANSAYSFNGTNNYIATTLDNLAGSELTIAYWFKGNNPQSAVRQQDGGNYVVAGWSIPTLHLLSNDGATDNGLALDATSGSTVKDGNWHHVVMTWKQNTTNGFKSYLDGALVAQRNSANVPIPEINTPVLISSYLGTGEFTNGALDDVYIYNRVLSPSDITTLGKGYTWSPAANLNSTSGAVVVANPIAATTYTVVARENNGTSSTAQTSVIVRPVNMASVTISASPSSGLCVALPVAWTDVVGCTVGSNNLTKTAALGWGNAGAASTQTVGEGSFVETIASETNTYRMLGLSFSNPDANYTSIQYGLFIRADGTLQIYESGAPKTLPISSYVSGDRLWISVEGGRIKYYKNNTLLLASTVIPPSLPLKVDVALYTTGSTLNYVKVKQTNSTITFTATPSNQGPNPLYEWYLNGVKVGAGSTSYSNSNLKVHDQVKCVLKSSIPCTLGNPVTSNVITIFNCGAVARMAFDEEKASKQELEKAISIRLYPNPTDKSFTLETDFPEETKQIQIVDMNGKVVRQMESQEAQTVIDVSNWKAGIYLIQTQIRGKSVNKKLVVVH